MDKKDFYFLGKIVKTSGYLGNLVFFFDVDNIEYYKDLEAVFVDSFGELIPFAIQSITIRNNNTAFVKLEDVDAEEEAIALVGSDVLLPLSYLPPLSGNKFYYHEIIGFKVMDKKKGAIGHITSVIDQGPQDIFVIDYNGVEILLPINDDIILDVQREKRSIIVQAPEGLIDIYLPNQE